MKIEPDGTNRYIVTIGKQKFLLGECSNGAAGLEIMGYSFPNCIQIEPQMNNLIQLRVRELE